MTFMFSSKYDLNKITTATHDEMVLQYFIVGKYICNVELQDFMNLFDCQSSVLNKKRKKKIVDTFNKINTLCKTKSANENSRRSSNVITTLFFLVILFLVYLQNVKS